MAQRFEGAASTRSLAAPAASPVPTGRVDFKDIVEDPISYLYRGYNSLR
jgi:hypothetical protein